MGGGGGVDVVLPQQTAAQHHTFPTTSSPLVVPLILKCGNRGRCGTYLSFHSLNGRTKGARNETNNKKKVSLSWKKKKEMECEKEDEDVFISKSIILNTLLNNDIKRKRNILLFTPYFPFTAFSSPTSNKLQFTIDRDREGGRKKNQANNRIKR